MKTEYEIRVLEIDHDNIVKQLEELGATKVFEAKQERKVYDFNPVRTSSWIRLRTNGIKTTLTIKEIKDKTIDGTKETEIEVSSFDTADELMNKLGYKYRSYQQNYRVQYDLNGVEIDLDKWPRIPEYMEIEGKNEEEVNEVLNKLVIDKEKVTTLDVTSIYEHYGYYDINSTKELLLEEDK